jgi:hypothetical protein
VKRALRLGPADKRFRDSLAGASPAQELGEGSSGQSIRRNREEEFAAQKARLLGSSGSSVCAGTFLVGEHASPSGHAPGQTTRSKAARTAGKASWTSKCVSETKKTRTWTTRLLDVTSLGGARPPGATRAFPERLEAPAEEQQQEQEQQ